MKYFDTSTALSVTFRTTRQIKNQIVIEPPPLFL